MLMAGTNKKQRERPHLRLIAFIGVMVPRRFRARFRQEWEAELEYRNEFAVCIRQARNPLLRRITCHKLVVRWLSL